MIFRGKKDNHRLLCEEVLEQKIEGNLMQSSDDETLSFVLKKLFCISLSPIAQEQTIKCFSFVICKSFFFFLRLNIQWKLNSCMLD